MESIIKFVNKSKCGTNCMKFMLFLLTVFYCEIFDILILFPATRMTSKLLLFYDHISKLFKYFKSRFEHPVFK